MKRAMSTGMFWAAGGLKKVDNTDVVGIKRSGDIDMGT